MTMDMTAEARLLLVLTTGCAELDIVLHKLRASIFSACALEVEDSPAVVRLTATIKPLFAEANKACLAGLELAKAFQKNARKTTSENTADKASSVDMVRDRYRTALINLANEVAEAIAQEGFQTEISEILGMLGINKKPRMPAAEKTLVLAREQNNIA